MVIRGVGAGNAVNIAHVPYALKTHARVEHCSAVFGARRVRISPEHREILRRVVAEHGIDADPYFGEAVYRVPPLDLKRKSGIVRFNEPYVIAAGPRGKKIEIVLC